MSSIFTRPSIDQLASKVLKPDLNAILAHGPEAVTDSARQLAQSMLAEGYSSKETLAATNKYTAQFDGLVSQAHQMRLDNYKAQFTTK
jgi:hypothetical protein